MTTDSLIEEVPAFAEADEPRRTWLTLDARQRGVLMAFVAAVLIAIAAPYPPTKYALGFGLALYWARLLFELDERFIGMFVLLLPTLQLAPLEGLGIPGLNWQTIFLFIFVGATLGNTLGRALALPLDLAAGVGLAALFGTAANTPLALSVMAVELLGGNAFPHVVIVSVVAYLASGHRGIYPAQRIARLKWDLRRLGRIVALRDLPAETPRESPTKSERE